jgi:hypothetical protein
MRRCVWPELVAHRSQQPVGRGRRGGSCVEQHEAARAIGVLGFPGHASLTLMQGIGSEEMNQRVDPMRSWPLKCDSRFGPNKSSFPQSLSRQAGSIHLT